MVQDLVSSARPKMEAALAHFQQELRSLRTGRASAGLLDTVTVSYYGTQVPLKQAATVTVPAPSMIQIQPFDTGMINEIRNAIVAAQLGFNPSDDGRVLRISVPPLTAERREELVKQAGKMAETTRIALRNIRGEVWESIQKAQKNGEISEDNRDWGRTEIDKVTADFNKKVEEALKQKETEIRTV